MGDWSELPKDLLQLISSRLESPLYILRFRSVCSSWRSSTPLTLTPTPYTHPIIPITNNFTHPITPPLINTFTLSHLTLLLIKPPNPNPNTNPNQRPWLLKLSHHHHHPRAPTARLFHPLSRTPLKPPPFHLHLLRLNTLDLGREFFLLANTQPNNSLYMEKLVLLSFPNDRFALLTIHVSGKLALFRSGDYAWTVIPDMPAPYDDVCVFRGRLYGVDYTGRTVTVELDGAIPALGLAAGPVFGGDKKFLVECEGKMLLVDKYLRCYDDIEEEVDVAGEIGWERTVRLEVYRLDEVGKRWVEVRNLGDWVLFLGDDCAFSASAEDLGVGRGNCIVFRDDFLGFNWVQNGMGVFSLDDGNISLLSDCPGFNQLFWPPPDWVTLH